MKSRLLRPEFIAVLLASAILIYVLMIPPVIGIADNGDFERIMGSTGLSYLSQDYKDKYFGYMNREYKVTPLESPAEDYFSTEIILVLLAKLIDKAVTLNKHIFDIRFLAFIYSCLFLLSIYLLVKFIRNDNPLSGWIIAALLVFVFTDIGYISYFNSLYGEAVSFSALLLTVALAICVVKQEKPSLFTLAGFFLAATLLAGAKAQNVPLGIVFTIFGIRLLPLRKDFLWKRAVIFFCVILILTTMKCYLSIPDRIRVCNDYQSVFYGILKDSPSPKDDLQELGLDPNLSALAGTDFFMKEYPINIRDPETLKQISDKINPLKVAVFYLKHPDRYLQKLRITAENGFRLIQGYGNFEKSENREFKETADSFRHWSTIKTKVLPHSLVVVALFFTVYFLLLVIQYVKKRKILTERLYTEIFAAIWVTGLIQFLIPIIGDGEADLGRHLFLFNVCFDIMLVTSVVWVINLTVQYTVKLINRAYLSGNST